MKELWGRYAGGMTSPKAFSGIGDERFVSLTTFRKSGVPVSTAVWIALDGDDLVVTTPATSGKVKRLRNSPRVELRPCDRMGRVKEGAIFLAKFRVEYRIFMFIERLGKQGKKDRVMLRISPAPE